MMCSYHAIPFTDRYIFLAAILIKLGKKIMKEMKNDNYKWKEKKSSNHQYFGLCFCFSRESILSAQCEYDDFGLVFGDFRCLHDCSTFFCSRLID